MELSDYPYRTTDKVRFSDTDKFGHVSNAVFGVYLETGRGEVLHGGADELADPGCQFVLARTEVDYRAQLFWPGEVESGLIITKLGGSSMTVEQRLFQEGRLCAEAVSVMVQVDAETGKPHPLSDRARARLADLMRSGVAPGDC